MFQKQRDMERFLNFKESLFKSADLQVAAMKTKSHHAALCLYVSEVAADAKHSWLLEWDQRSLKGKLSVY